MMGSGVNSSLTTATMNVNVGVGGAVESPGGVYYSPANFAQSRMAEHQYSAAPPTSTSDSVGSGTMYASVQQQEEGPNEYAAPNDVYYSTASTHPGLAPIVTAPLSNNYPSHPSASEAHSPQMHHHPHHAHSSMHTSPYSNTAPLTHLNAMSNTGGNVPNINSVGSANSQAIATPPSPTAVNARRHSINRIGSYLTFATGPLSGRTIRAEIREVQKADLGRKCADPPTAAASGSGNSVGNVHAVGGATSEGEGVDSTVGPSNRLGRTRGAEHDADGGDNPNNGGNNINGPTETRNVRKDRRPLDPPPVVALKLFERFPKNEPRPAYSVNSTLRPIIQDNGRRNSAGDRIQRDGDGDDNVEFYEVEIPAEEVEIGGLICQVDLFKVMIPPSQDEIVSYGLANLGGPAGSSVSGTISSRHVSRQSISPHVLGTRVEHTAQQGQYVYPHPHQGNPISGPPYSPYAYTRSIGTSLLNAERVDSNEGVMGSPTGQGTYKSFLTLNSSLNCHEPGMGSSGLNVGYGGRAEDTNGHGGWESASPVSPLSPYANAYPHPHSTSSSPTVHPQTPLYPNMPPPNLHPQQQHVRANALSRLERIDPDALPPPSESDKLTRALFGESFAHACSILDLSGRSAIYFVFADLSVKLEGLFRPRYRFFDLFSRTTGCADVPVLAQCFGGAFAVYSTKEFPGLKASTPLTKHLSRWGIRVNIRETERKRRGPMDGPGGGAPGGGYGGGGGGPGPGPGPGPGLGGGGGNRDVKRSNNSKKRARGGSVASSGGGTYTSGKGGRESEDESEQRERERQREREAERGRERVEAYSLNNETPRGVDAPLRYLEAARGRDRAREKERGRR